MTVQKCRVFDFIKMVVLFIIYFLCNNVVKFFLDYINISDNILALTIADLLFLFVIVLFYKKDINKELYNIKHEYKVRGVLKIVFKFLIIIVFVNFIISFIANIFNNNVEEFNSIQKLVNQSIPYLVFKSLIFSPIAETILFQKSIRKVIGNNLIYVVISALIFTLVNVMYMDFNSNYFIFDIFGYFIMSSIFAYMYVKTNNIFFVIFVKFLYNIIPLIANIILLMGVLN